MKVEYILFGSGVFFFAPLAVIYGALADWEAVGTTGLFLTAGLSAMIGGYLAVTSRRIDARPEDNPSALIHDGAGEQGFFAPYSWWPLPLAASAAIAFTGLAIGLWLFLIGVGLGAVALVGWVFEHYRGEHAH